MCIFAELYLGSVPFTIWRGGGLVTIMVEIRGHLPEEWKGFYLYQTRDSWYGPDTKPRPNFLISAIIARAHPESDPIERQQILPIMTEGFSYHPEKRPTATQLLQDSSFTAIMEKYCH